MFRQLKGIAVAQVALEIENLALSVAERQLFFGLSIRLDAGQRLLLRGASGCGKSTLLNCLLGFVTPSAGKIRIFGQDLDSRSVWRLRTRMAYVSQEPELPDGRVRDLLARPFSFRANQHLRQNLSALPALFERLLLPRSLLELEVNKLSGGEKQRVALAGALMLEREILLLDEASSALDPNARQAVVELLAAHQELTILAVSHDSAWEGFAADTLNLTPGGRG
jgi:ABC-type iron transport system FetAB ATPase subunit